MANKASAAWRLAILLGLVLQLAAVQANMMTMRREVDGLKEAGAGGDAGDEDKDTKYDVDDEIDEHNDEGGCSADGRGRKPGAVT